ncbi:MAG: hypothetical protein RPU52_12235, partial [Candidatus Sedimenticola sp. (ex Thyasira tokunagai)]
EIMATPSWLRWVLSTKSIASFDFMQTGIPITVFLREDTSFLKHLDTKGKVFGSIVAGGAFGARRALYRGSRNRSYRGGLEVSR